MRVLKDLIPDMSDFYKQYESIQPWLKNKTTSKKENLQSPEDRKKYAPADRLLPIQSILVEEVFESIRFLRLYTEWDYA